MGVDMFALSGGNRLEIGEKEAKWMFDWAFAGMGVDKVCGGPGMSRAVMYTRCGSQVD